MERWPWLAVLHVATLTVTWSILRPIYISTLLHACMSLVLAVLDLRVLIVETHDSNNVRWVNSLSAPFIRLPPEWRSFTTVCLTCNWSDCPSVLQLQVWITVLSGLILGDKMKPLCSAWQSVYTLTREHVSSSGLLHSDSDLAVLWCWFLKGGLWVVGKCVRARVSLWLLICTTERLLKTNLCVTISGCL